MRLLLDLELQLISPGKSSRLAAGLLTFCVFWITSVCSAQQEVFELDPSQSMLITGKGPGQDGAINPYSDRESIALVGNIGENPFEVRIQMKGEIVEIRSVPPGKTAQFPLKKGYELYLDSKQAGNAEVKFSPAEPE